MNRNSSFSPSAKRVGGGPLRIFAGLLLVAAVTVGGLAFVLVSSPVSKGRPAAEAESSDSSLSEGSSSSSWSIWLDEPDDSPEAAQSSRVREFSTEVMDHVSNFETPTVKEVIERLHEMGDYSGFGAFNPPGTRPAMIGLAVPEDFVLPEGFVRHHQVTDDGQRIEPILMFAPDYDHRDAYNQPIAIPADRIVPPELAPRGLPHRRIEVPKPIGPDGYDL